MKSLLVLIIVLWLSNNSVQSQCTAIINTFPYNESFEGGTANWVSLGTSNDWAWGTPTKPVINSAGNGTKCWIAGGLTTSFYNLGERSWVESPCFDFTTLNYPYISFQIFWETEYTYDGGNLQYTIDGGAHWITVGRYNEPAGCNNSNWYNIDNVTNLSSFVNNNSGWAGTTQPSSGSCRGGHGSGGWITATHCLSALAHVSQVKFRFTFGSGTTCNDYDGFAFDNITISEAPPLTSDFNFNCTGINSITFSDSTSSCHDKWLWHFGDINSADNTSVINNPVHHFDSGGDYSIMFTTSGGCSPETTIIKQIKILSADISSGPVSCIDGADGFVKVTVINPGSSVNYSWSNDPNLNSPRNPGLPVGDYTVSIDDASACSLTLASTVKYGPYADPEVSLGEDTTICPGSVFKLNAKGFTSYIWQDNSSDSDLTVSSSGIYSVSVINSAGCNATDTILIKEDCLRDIVVPNTFTPNGDGLNELFYVDGSETTYYELIIYDRWGNKIFYSRDRKEGWNGNIKGHPAQEGVYNYLLNYSVNGIDYHYRNGHLNLVR